MIKSPFPYFGGKLKVAATVWARFGNVQSYIEPFFGSGAVLLNRPQQFSGVETVNGSTGIACRNLGRRFIGIELDRRFFRMAQKRLKQEALCPAS